MTSTSIQFSHTSPLVGTLQIENGLDKAQWAYNLNTAVFPTYGGEVVQILSVYIDDLTIGGTVSTYSQCEAIYSYFAAYFQIATQGVNPTPVSGTSAYNLQPMQFTYPHRNWRFEIYPKSAPGFAYNWDAVGRQWQLTAHVIDDSPDLESIKDAIKNSAIQSQLTGFARLNGEISPDSGNPETNPFQTYDKSAAQVTQSVTQYGDYYQSLISSYTTGDFAALTGGLGSMPATYFSSGAATGTTVQVPTTQSGSASGS